MFITVSATLVFLIRCRWIMNRYLLFWRSKYSPTALAANCSYYVHREWMEQC